MHDSKSDKKNKKTLIIPAAGKSSRFPDMKPKWLLTHSSGKIMIEKVLEGLDLTFYDEIYFIILKEHCEKYDADLILNQAFSNLKINICILEKETASCPETVYMCIIKNKIYGNVVIKDCDSYVEFNQPNYNNFVVSSQITNKIKNIHNKSFIISDQNNIILDIIEKKISSDKISIGVYSLEAIDFLESYEKLKDYIFSELYMSHIISDIINSNKKTFLNIFCTEYIDWGTSKEWFSSDNYKQTYLFDIDGILLINTGKYGKKNWFNSLEPIEENIKILKNLSDTGNEIIFITSRTEEALTLFKQYLINNNIKYKDIIHSCLHSKRTIINDFSNTNPFPSCNAINIPRNQLIKSYIEI